MTHEDWITTTMRLIQDERVFRDFLKYCGDDYSYSIEEFIAIVQDENLLIDRFEQWATRALPEEYGAD